MKYVRYPGTSWYVSKVGMGCWGLGGQYGPVSREQALETLRAAYDAGINLFDTADAYGLEMGTSESLMGQVLPFFRDDIFIASKVGNWGRRHGAPLPYTHPTHVIGCCHASLYRLRTDCIDLYQCHIGDLEEPDVFLEAFEKLRDQGKIRLYGISTNSLKVVEAFDREGKCSVVQLDHSLLNRSAEEELLPYCDDNEIGTLIRGPLAQGLLTGKFSRETTFDDQVRQKWNEGEGRQAFEEQLEVVDKLREFTDASRGLTQLALQYCLATPGVTAVIPGAKSPVQVRALAEAADRTLDRDTRQKILDLFQ